MSDLIRVTGYLMKRSELEKLKKGEVVANDSVALVVDKTPQRHMNEKKARVLMNKAPVNKIIASSVVDGPGGRQDLRTLSQKEGYPLQAGQIPSLRRP
ncbi:MAG: DUF3029 family protein [Erysipelotrichaceae bacterium]|nr:DUF3029 family protein [Erysipelotrichaceae bacterium]